MAEPSAKAEVAVLFFLDQAKSAAAQSQWERAESCLAQGLLLDPKSRDLAFYAARLKAWQGKHEEASALIRVWPATDAESREIRGDLAWYRNDVNEAESWYRAGINNRASVESWKLWIKALRAKKDKNYRAALVQALGRFPEDAELKAWAGEKEEARKDGLENQPVPVPTAVPVPAPAPIPKTVRSTKGKKVDRDRSAYRAAVGGSLVRETQNQSFQSLDADIAVIAQRKSLSLGASQATRDYGPLSLTDRSFRLGLGFGILHDPSRVIQSEETTISGGGSPDPDFSPLRIINIRHELFFSDAFSLFGELGARWYRDIYVRTAMLGTHVAFGAFHYGFRAYNTQAKHNDSSASLAAAYQSESFRPEVFVRGGRDAASRPYLFGLENETFFALGAQLDYRFTGQWTTRTLVEQRWENGFHQESISLVLMWYDR